MTSTHISGTGPLPAHGFRSVLSSRARCPEPHSRLMDTSGCAHTHSLRAVPASAMVLSWTFLSKIFLKTPQAEFVPRLNISPLQIWGLPVSLTTVCWWVLRVPPRRHPLTPAIYPFLGPTVTWWATPITSFSRVIFEVKDYTCNLLLWQHGV